MAASGVDKHVRPVTGKLFFSENVTVNNAIALLEKNHILKFLKYILQNLKSRTN